MTFGRAVSGGQAEGQEVCINYGSKELEEFVLFYGLIPSQDASTARIFFHGKNGIPNQYQSVVLVRHVPPGPMLLDFVDDQCSPSSMSHKEKCFTFFMRKN